MQIVLAYTAEYTMKLTPEEIKALRDIAYKVKHINGGMATTRINELVKHQVFATELMDMCDKYLTNWMEETNSASQQEPCRTVRS